jgi:hypothetical protein
MGVVEDTLTGVEGNDTIEGAYGQDKVAYAMNARI